MSDPVGDIYTGSGCYIYTVLEGEKMESKINDSVISADRLKEICNTLLSKVGVNTDNRDIITDSIVEANLHGIDTHGIAILPTYLERIRRGATKPNPNVKIIKEGTSFSVFDGDNGLGAVTGVKAVEKAVKESKTKGAYICLCRNNNTFGSAFYYNLLAAKEGMVGITMCNAPSSMPPWGGKKILLGTNPISIAVPVEGKNPIVLDMATSAAAKSKIYLARDKGEKIPLGWALDKDGNPTTEPEEALKGFILPLGGHKGYGLALMIDILAGVLSGAGSLDEVGSLHNRMDRGQNVGFLFIVINPELTTGKEEFSESIQELTRKIKECPTLEEGKSVILPGEIEKIKRSDRLKNGIPIPASIMKQLNELLKD